VFSLVVKAGTTRSTTIRTAPSNLVKESSGARNEGHTEYRGGNDATRPVAASGSAQRRNGRAIRRAAMVPAQTKCT